MLGRKELLHFSGVLPWRGMTLQSHALLPLLLTSVYWCVMAPATSISFESWERLARSVTVPATETPDANPFGFTKSVSSRDISALKFRTILQHMTPLTHKTAILSLVSLTWLAGLVGGVGSPPSIPLSH